MHNGRAWWTLLNDRTIIKIQRLSGDDMKSIRKLPYGATALCLASLAGAAPAQTSTQLYGLLDMWAGRSQTSAGGPASTVVNSGGMQTSFWGWGGTEDLGDGLKAVFARNAYVGLQGRAGELKIGRILNPLFVATAQVNPFGGSIRFAPLLAQVWSLPMGRAVSGDTSWDNALSYTTPAMGGFRLAGYTGLGETGFGTSTNNAGATLSYSGGPALFYWSVQRVRVGPGLAAIGRSQQKTGFAGGSYDVGGARLYASFGTARSNAPDATARTGQIGMSLDAGKGKVLLSWARTNNVAAGKADTKRDTGAVGYDYVLSKRTDLYAVIQTDKLSTAETAKTYAVGVRHRY
jgi:predicted porin